MRLSAVSAIGLATPCAQFFLETWPSRRQNRLRLYRSMLFRPIEMDFSMIVFLGRTNFPVGLHVPLSCRFLLLLYWWSWTSSDIY